MCEIKERDRKRELMPLNEWGERCRKKVTAGKRQRHGNKETEGKRLKIQHTLLNSEVWK